MHESAGTQPDRAILVGYDGSRNAGAALGWAQREASQLSAPVQLVYVFEWGTPTGSVPMAASWPDQQARRETEAAVSEAVGRARHWHPEVTITGTVIDGGAVSTLRQLSKQARLLVLGDRGLGGFPGLRAGSVATELAAYAHCPVVIVRGAAPTRSPVVVGIDDSRDYDEALQFAFEEANARGVELVAVRACEPPPVPHRPDTPPPAYQPGKHELAQQRLAERVLQGWPDQYPQVRTSVELASGRPADALITASERAQLVVVGARGRHGPEDIPLAPTAGHLIQYAHCPVGVVRLARDRAASPASGTR